MNLPGPERALTHESRLSRSFPYLACVAAALLATWPLGVLPWRAPTHANFAGHLAVLGHIPRWLLGREPLEYFNSFNFPQGVNVKVVAWPIMGLATLLEPLFGPIVALNLAQLGFVALGGILLVLALRRLRVASPGAMLAGVAWTAPSLVLTFVGCGQFENLTGWTFSLGLYGLALGGWTGVGLVLLSSFFTAFSSPYQSVVLAMVLLCGFLALRPRRALFMALAASLAVVPAFYYYGRPSIPLAVEMGPGPAKEVGELAPRLLLQPKLLSSSGRPQVSKEERPRDWPAYRDTLRYSLGILAWPDHKPAEPTSPEFMHRVYLGVILTLLAVLGLLSRARSPLVLLALPLFIISLALAMGRQQAPIQGFAWPWAWSTQISALREMASTYRFATGAIFALCLCAALLPDRLMTRFPRAAWVLAALGSVLCVLDSLSMGPFKVPLSTMETELPQGYAALPETGAVLTLPIRGYRVPFPDPSSPTLLAALHEHPVSMRPVTNASDLILDLPLVKAADGEIILEPWEIASSAGAVRAMGFSYLALHTSALGRDVDPMFIGSLQEALGPADAAGGGVLGWRLDNDP